MRSQIGQIGLALNQVREADTPLQQQTARLVRVLASLVGVLCVVMVLTLGWRTGQWVPALLSGIALAMAILPEEYSVVLTLFPAMGDIEQKVSGRIEANERLTMRIGSSVTGRVIQVFAEVGDRVKAGQSLATLSSPELTNAQLSYLRALSMSSLAERAVERAKALVAADVIGTAELQRREVELSVARAELRAAHDQLQLIGLREETIEKLRQTGAIASEVNIRATRSGVVIERKVSQGQVAQPGDPMFTVADLSNVWVVGALPELDANSVQLNQKVDVQVSALGIQKLSGRIVFVSDTVQPDTRTVPIRTEVNNPKFELKPQMLATLTISGMHVKQLAVPATAVVRENDKDYVFVKIAENRFRLTEVTLDTAAGELRPVRKGIDEGTPIVVDGSFHLNSQRKRAELE
jgi:cobalt-zinc-cadmium efflux system membrane fusion protein